MLHFVLSTNGSHTPRGFNGITSHTHPRQKTFGFIMFRSHFMFPSHIKDPMDLMGFQHFKPYGFSFKITISSKPPKDYAPRRFRPLGAEGLFLEFTKENTIPSNSWKYRKCATCVESAKCSSGIGSWKCCSARLLLSNFTSNHQKLILR